MKKFGLVFTNFKLQAHTLADVQTNNNNEWLGKPWAKILYDRIYFNVDRTGTCTKYFSTK